MNSIDDARHTGRNERVTNALTHPHGREILISVGWNPLGRHLVVMVETKGKGHKGQQSGGSGR